MSRCDVARVDFYFDDWLTGTMELSAEQRGAYITVCALIWKTGNRLKDNDAVLARWCAMSVRKWRAVRQLLIEAGKLEVADGYIRQQRAEAELETARERREKARENGAKGGRKKAENEAKSQKPNGSGPSGATTYQQQHLHQDKKEESLQAAAESVPRARARDDGADAPAAAAAGPPEIVSPETMNELLERYPMHTRRSMQRELEDMGRGAPRGAVARGIGKARKAQARDWLSYAQRPIAEEAAGLTVMREREQTPGAMSAIEQARLINMRMDTDNGHADLADADHRLAH
jgi:uncharacterized protein YdaU (DUF1376 family)